MRKNTPEETQLVRWAVIVSNPVRGITLPPLTATAAELRHRAQQRAAPRRPAVPRRSALAAASAVVLFTLGGSLFAGGAAVAAPAPLRFANALPAPAAQLWLEDTATRILAGASTVDGGPVTHIHLQRWSMDTTDPAPQIIPHDEVVWWLPDRSARTAITELPALPPGSRRVQWWQDIPPWSKTVVTDWGPGSYSTVIAAPSINPAHLATQLATHEPPSNGPQATVRAIAAVWQKHHLNPAQRAALLRVLASVDTLVFRGSTEDRAGRPGVAVSVDSSHAGGGSVRDIVVFDPLTGALLSHEMVTLTPAAQEKVPSHTVTSYTLFLSSGHLPGPPWR